jgi:hypothetical protein
MKSTYLSSLLLVITLSWLGLAPVSQAQNSEDHIPSKERSQFQDRRKSILDGNNVRATYHNFGWAGRISGQDEIIFEYPKNTGRQYMYLFAFFIGAEVQDQAPGATGVLRVVNSPNGRTSQGRSWNMNPVAGYFNPSSPELARSDRGPGSSLGNTWPSFWPDKMTDTTDPGWPNSWNGFFGKNIFNADQEFFYRASDDNYTRFIENGRFSPDKTDPTRGGLAIKLDTRVLAWSQILIADVHFNIMEVFNDGSYNYDKMAFSLWVADWVGTPSNDRPEFDQRRAIAYLTDLQRTQSPPEYNGQPIGMLAMKFLETPGNAFDGIDNDGDSDLHDGTNTQNADLFGLLTSPLGFYNRAELISNVIPFFTADDFNSRTIRPGDKIVLIQPNGDRVISTYPQGGGTVVSQGRTITLPPNGITLVEDALPIPGLTNEFYNTDLLDNDLDGLIDENRPNHLTKQTLVNGNFIPRPVRYINYLNFQVGDTIQRGLIVPNRLIAQRKASNPSFPREDRNYFTSAPMIDESRDDRFDNDRDWVEASDDVGLDGVEGTGDTGEGDGKPSSGAFTPFPGEPNIDKTDVSESDQIGISSVTFPGAGTLGSGPNFATDESFWNNNMRPGIFEAGATSQDSDILITSSFFPLRRGSIERFAVAISVAQTNGSLEQDRTKNNDNLVQATNAYEADYQFAVAPRPPKLKAVAGDGFVTLYWDTESEQAFDRYVDKLGLPGNDFEGYKVYKSTDPAFSDAKTITDGYGNLIFNRPIAQFDKVNGLKGFHPVDVNGVKFYLGSDSGLRREFVDTDVINGRVYYYAVTAYDFGATPAGIAPSESAIQINLNPDGSVVTGENVVVVRPRASTAGYINPENPLARLTQGSAGGQVRVSIVDPDSLRANNLYRVVFRDTLIRANNPNVPDTVKTKDFSLLNIAGGRVDTLIKNSREFRGESLPVIQGFRLSVTNAGEVTRYNPAQSGWKTNRTVTIHEPRFEVFRNQTKPSDYEIVMGPPGFSTSKDTTIRIGAIPVRAIARQVNFKVFNRTENREIPFAFLATDGQDGNFSASTFTVRDEIIFIETVGALRNQFTWRVYLVPSSTVQTVNPTNGDQLELKTIKPFTAQDVYEFQIDPSLNMARVDVDSAKSSLDKIKVVPNPYIVTNIVEPRPTTARPQQSRQLHFNHLPSKCTIYIYTVSGQLVNKLDVNNRNDDGTYVWNMLTKDNLELSYGIYLFVVDAPGVGVKKGKFAVIK